MVGGKFIKVMVMIVVITCSDQRILASKDFDLTNEAVKKKMKERYGSKVPLNEPVISPAALFNSELLVTVKAN